MTSELCRRNLTKMRRHVAGLAAVVVISGCSASPEGADQMTPAARSPTQAAPVTSSTEAPAGQSTTEEPTATPPSTLTLLALGDSWSYGAHCNGCTPFPELYAEGLEEQIGRNVKFVDLVKNGGTSATMVQDLSSNVIYRQEVSKADIILINTGANDMEPFGQSWKTGTCGGADGLDCFRELEREWRDNFDAMLDEVDALRGGKPTAVRLVTNSNEFLSDPGLIDYFGADFGPTGGAAITAMHHDALCAAAAEHDAVCVDLRPVLNGANLDQPQDVNTQDAMQAVADALVASGTHELEG